MTKQELFDKVVAHLRSQGKQSMDATGGLCMYRNPDGLKCAVGVLIPDDKYHVSLEGQQVSSWNVRRAAGLDDKELADLAYDLQGVHDSYMPHLWEERLQVVAINHGLNYRAPGGGR